MDSKLLIEAIVKQTTVLIASLSTASGIRAPLSHVADQVFLDLAEAIESQGVGKKVVADMFGLALRTYQRKVQRLSESVSERNRSLWEAVFAYVYENEPVDRRVIGAHFYNDSPEDVAAILNDLVTNGLASCTRHGKKVVYRTVIEGQQAANTDSYDSEVLADVIWVNIFHNQARTIASLSKTLGISRDDIARAVHQLIQDGRISCDQKERCHVDGASSDEHHPTDQTILMASTLLVPVGTTKGWEAAVFDHFSTVAAAIAAKVNQGPGSQEDDVVGGATLCFEINTGHPFQADVFGLLKRIRSEVNELWEKVEHYNRAHPISEDEKEKVHFYFGQNTTIGNRTTPIKESDDHES